MYEKTARELLAFIERSPSCFHVIANMARELEGRGFIRLEESAPWAVEPGKGYFVVRNGSALIGFVLPNNEALGFQIMACHSDSPCFKIKENAEIEADKAFVSLNVEKYGGMLCSTWLDRPLSVAGRVMVREGSRISARLVNVDRDLLLIPNLAIHMNPKANEGYAYNAQKDMLPLFGDKDAKGSFKALIAKEAGVEEEAILAGDLFLYNRMKGSVWGANNEFVSIGRLDDLQCAFAGLQAFVRCRPSRAVSVFCVLDNEEVGSATKQGAASPFLRDTLMRLNRAMGRDEEGYYRALASSFMLSSDNAHSVHPNHPDKSDQTNRPYMNGGIVIKHSANQKYTTDAASAAIFKALCGRAGVPVQSFVNRSDMAGGSTLGNISNTKVALNTVDIGLAQLSMHSSYETAGARDTQYLIQAATEFFNSALICHGDGDYELTGE